MTIPRMPLSLLLAVFFTASSLIPFAAADVWIPEDEYLGYFDSQGVYTVVGAVKNTESHAVVPTITITINGVQQIEQQLPRVFPNKDIPFKIPIKHVSGDVVLGKPIVVFEENANAVPSNVEVIYDGSLKRHHDGHLTGKIINKGNTTEYDLEVYATIHGQGNAFLDVGKSLENIEKIEPGQIIDFTMYPESAIGDETVISLYAIRDGEKFDFRYDSTAAFTAVGFDESGTNLRIDGINSFKVPTFVNFEFPMTSEREKFEVLVNEKQIPFIQSVDEEGNWHVAFDVDGASQYKILIGGFENTEKKHVIQNIKPNDAGHSFLYYVIPVAAAIGASVYLYKRKKPRPAN